MQTNQVRIIGGKWRSRKIDFLSKPDLRPTSDRTRETVFNWLAPFIAGMNCLDLFAGSGALGFEALSRGANKTTFVDNDIDNINQLKQNGQKLNVQHVDYFLGSANDFLKQNQKKFDLLFLDPPFELDIMEETVALIETFDTLTKSAYIYMEIPLKSPIPTLPLTWSILKEKKSKQVRYFLIKRQK